MSYGRINVTCLQLLTAQFVYFVVDSEVKSGIFSLVFLMIYCFVGKLLLSISIE